MYRHNVTIGLFILLLTFTSVAAQRPDAPHYAQRGPYAVGTRDFVVEDDQRPLEIALWYPASNPDHLEEVTDYRYGLFALPGHAIRDAEPAADGAPYPVVLFSHGNAGLRFQSTFLMEHLASHGFIVGAIDHPTNSLLDTANREQFGSNLPSNLVYRPQDMARLYEFVLSLNNTADFRDLIDPEKLAITGHSFGGYTAIASAGARLNFSQLSTLCEQLQSGEGLSQSACWLPDQIGAFLEALDLDSPPQGAWPEFANLEPDAIVALAPWNGPVFDAATLSQLQIPTLFMVGTNDRVTPPQRDAYFLYQQMSSAPRLLVTLELAGHYIFVDQCIDIALRLGLFDQCSDPIWDMQRAHDLINHFITGFLLSELQGSETARLMISTPQHISGVGYYSEPGAFETRLRGIQRLLPEVLERYEHDPEAWTQGLLLHDEALYESTGQYGESTLRRVDPATGQVLYSVSLAPDLFGEGLAKVGDRLIQITWKEKTALVYTLDTFELLGEFTYEGEGWGLCYDGTDLYMSNGSSEITRRDPETFEPLEVYTVTANSYPTNRLNELECVGDDIYANIINEDFIVRFNKQSGIINAYIDTRQMRLPDEVSGNVLNGIAYDNENDLFYLTGKYWPRMYLVRLVPES